MECNLPRQSIHAQMNRFMPDVDNSAPHQNEAGRYIRQTS
jgi:hypothetical protein